MKRITSVLFAAALLLAPAASPRAADSTITISQGVDTDTLNPLTSTITTTFNVVGCVYERLFDRGATPTQLQPALAVSWRRVDLYTEEYRLRRGVRFSNGDPFTSADVRYSVDWIKNPANRSQQIAYVRDVDRVETPDPYTVRFISRTQTAIPPGQTTPIFIVDAKYFESKGGAYATEHPVGTGPYVVREWKRDDALILDANPSWWGGKPGIEHVTFKPIQEAGTRVAALRTGAVDLITNVPYQNQIQIVGSRDTKLLSVRSLRQLFIGFNTMQPGPQQNKLVRQAVNYAVDVGAIVKNVVGGRGFESTSVVPANYVGYDPAVAPYKHDLRKAKALLAQAGFPDGKGLSFVLNTPNGRYNRDREVAEAIAGQLQAAGIATTVRPQEWFSYYNQLTRRAETPMYLLGWAVAAADADNIFTALLNSDGPLSTYANPEVDRLTVQARAELDPRRRLKLYSQLATIVHDDAAWIPLFQYEDLYGASKRLQWQPRGDERIRPWEMSLK